MNERGTVPLYDLTRTWPGGGDGVVAVVLMES